MKQELLKNDKYFYKKELQNYRSLSLTLQKKYNLRWFHIDKYVLLKDRYDLFVSNNFY